MANNSDLSKPTVLATNPEGEAQRKPRGRPAGSKNKTKPPIIITRDSPNALKAHAIEVSSGCDVNECLINFSRRNQRGMSILSVTGCVQNVTLRQAAQAGSTVTLHGRFEILSLTGSFLPTLAPPGVSGLTVYIAGAQGQVVGGAAVGSLLASGPVVIIVALFMNASFDRLPLEEDEVAPLTVAHGFRCENGRPGTHVDALNYYGLPQNVLTSTGILPQDGYSWNGPGMTLSKTI